MHVGHRDFHKASDLLSPRVVYRVPGNHVLAGVFSGREEVTAHLTTLLERTKGTYDALKWDDWLQGEHYVAALADIRIQVAGRSSTERILFLVKFESDDAIAEVIVFFQDLRAVELLFGSTSDG
jgi:ketosteroid isomerase-like protein